MVGILAYFILYPTNAVPGSCSFVTNFMCEDVVVATNSITKQTTMYLNITNEGIYPVEDPALKAQLFNSAYNTTTAQCYPDLVQPGGSMLCVLNLSTQTSYYQDVTGSIYLSVLQCGLAANYTLTGSCAGAPAETVIGTFNSHATYLSRFRTGTIYCVGTNSTPPYNYAYYAPTYSDGSLGAWSPTTGYPTAMVDASCSIYDGHIYCVGGYNGISALRSSYYAAVSDNGIGGWNATASYPIGLNQSGCSISGGRAYCVGTAAVRPYNYTYYSVVSASGMGKWQPTTPYPIANSSNSCSIYNGYIYCVGVSSGGTAAKRFYYAQVLSSGIGAWTQGPSFPSQYSNAGCTAYDGYIYCVGTSAGGRRTSPYSWYAQIGAGGAPGSWQHTTAYPSSLYNAGCSIYDGYMYCVGNGSGNTVGVYYAQVTSNGIGTWQPGTQYPLAMYNSYCAAAGESGGYYG